jgi:hypothetical protein
MEKPDILKCNNLLANGFSLITVGENKIPNFSWKKYQTEANTKDEFEKAYNYAGGKEFVNKSTGEATEIKPTDGIGIVTGYKDLEVIDVDLKVLSTALERKIFWDDYYNLLRDNIVDFENKFVIAETKNYGYHILYRNSNLQGNTKIAKLKGMKEAIIESRGKGGYVFMYDKILNDKYYTDIKEVSDTDREILWHTSTIFDYKEDVKIEAKNIDERFSNVEETPWDAFNRTNKIWDIVSSDFTIVKRLNDKLIIKRNGATSPHSGYIYLNDNKMYLFSTGTQYPHEKAIKPFEAYAINKFNGNYKECASFLYHENAGSRLPPKDYPSQYKKNEPKKGENKIEVPEIITTNFPVEIYPEFLQTYIKEVSITLNANIDFLGSALLWAVSMCIGNSLKLEVKRGWQESAIVWIVLVGRAGVGKTHTIKAITDVLEKISGAEVRKYAQAMERYENYLELDKKEKMKMEKVEKPKKKKFIAEDITIEALSELHEQNKNGIGILRDELVGWIKDMNKYREGSDLQKYLSIWSNGVLSSDRKTSGSAYVDKAFISIIGGVQPNILSSVYTEENKENGFIDRLLICYPDIEVGKYNTKQIDQSLIDHYSEFISFFYDQIKTRAVNYDQYDNVISNVIPFSEEADIEWQRIFNEITDKENSDEENEYIKSVLPKLKSYVCRFSLILEVLHSFVEHREISCVNVKSVLSAEKLYKYFFLMAKKNKVNTMETNDIKEVIKFSGKRTAFDKFKVLFVDNPNLNRSKISSELNVSRRTIISWIKEIEAKSVK